MDNLPTELQEHILIHLSPRDLAHLRASAKVFRKIVQSNIRFVCRTLAASTIRPFRDTVDHLINFDKDSVDMLDCLRRYVKHRGPHRLWYAWYGHDTIACKALQYLWSIKYIPQNFRSCPLERLYLLADWLLALHHFTHGANKDRPKRISWQQAYEDLIENKMGSMLRECGYDEYTVSRWTHEIAAHGLGPNPEPGYNPYDFTAIKPRLYLTPSLGLGNEFDYSEEHNPQAPCSVEQLERLFGLPAIPRSEHFAWCAKSEWAYSTIKQATQDGLELEPLLKCALLEELYLD